MKFSIGIPAYKGKFLKECIDSILIQSYNDFELIIINDASPDDIDEIIGSYSDPRISYYKNGNNIGAENVINNWNKCLDLAKGDYFLLMGDDDMLDDNFLSEITILIDNYPDLDLFHTRSRIININGNVLKNNAPLPEFETIYDAIIARMANNRLQYISDFIYRTEALKKEGGFYFLPCAWYSDDISAYRAMGNKGIASTNKTFLNYRRNVQTISSSGDIALKLRASIHAQKWINEYLKDENVEHYALWQEAKNIVNKGFKRKNYNLITAYCNKIGFFKTFKKIRPFYKKAYFLDDIIKIVLRKII